MATVRITGRCIKISYVERRMYPRDIVICESLEYLAKKLGANVRHVELEHDMTGVYKNIYIVNIGAKDFINA